MAKTVTARANRSFGTIREGDVVTIDETDARLQAFLASGYMTEVEGDDAKGAKKVDGLADEEQVIVWDGKPSDRRGATTTGAAKADAEAEAKPVKAAPNAKDNHGAG